MPSPKGDRDRTLASSQGPLRAHGEGSLRVLVCPAPGPQLGSLPVCVLPVCVCHSVSAGDFNLSSSAIGHLPAQLGAVRSPPIPSRGLERPLFLARLGVSDAGTGGAVPVAAS